MFEKLSQAAETTADSVSRRAFLKRLGTGAAATAAVFGGVLASTVEAGRGDPCQRCYRKGLCCRRSRGGTGRDRVTCYSCY